MGVYGPLVALAENMGHGAAVSCFNRSTLISCPTAYGSGDLAYAWSVAYKPEVNSSLFTVMGLPVSADSEYIGTLAGGLIGERTGVFDRAPEDTLYVAYGSNYSTVCIRNPNVGTGEDNHFFLTPYCDVSQNLTFGNASDESGFYSAFYGCLDEVQNSYILEYGVGSISVGEGVLAVTCFLSGEEGLVHVSFNNHSGTHIGNYEPIRNLSSIDLNLAATGVLYALAQDAGVYGKLGIMGQTFTLAVLKGTSYTSIHTVERMISNALAAATSITYFSLASDYKNEKDQYVNVYNGSYTVTLSGVGWQASWQLLTWSIISLLVSVAWLGCTFYICQGGTHYDPSDWYDTVNLAAGSAVTQLPDTCAGIQKLHNLGKEQLWYGETRPSHLGLSMTPGTIPSKDVKYGNVQRNCVTVEAGALTFKVNKGKRLKELLALGAAVQRDHTRGTILLEVHMHKMDFLTVTNLGLMDARLLITALTGLVILLPKEAYSAELKKNYIPTTKATDVVTMWKTRQNKTIITNKTDVAQLIKPAWLEHHKAYIKAGMRKTSRYTVRHSQGGLSDGTVDELMDIIEDGEELDEQDTEDMVDEILMLIFLEEVQDSDEDG